MEFYPDSGVYILKIKLKKEKNIKVGALGKRNFKTGYYFYTGTAQRNLEARIKRHYSSEKKLYWHIDYLLAQSELKRDFILELPGVGECFLAKTLVEIGGKTLVEGFGASDCSCDSHLIYFSLSAGKNIVEKLLKRRDLAAEFKDFKNSK